MLRYPSAQLCILFHESLFSISSELGCCCLVDDKEDESMLIWVENRDDANRLPVVGE